jgi:hypothetical protein
VHPELEVIQKGQSAEYGTQWRVYYKDAPVGAKITAMFAEKTGKQLSVSAPMGIYNDKTANSMLGSQYNPALAAVISGAQFDSWATLGFEDNSAGTELSTIGCSFAQDVSVNGATSATCSDGLIFVTPDKAYEVKERGDKVLLAQITSAGKVSGNFNAQFVTSNGELRMSGLNFCMGGESTPSTPESPSPKPCFPPSCPNPGDCEYVNAVYDDNQCLVSCGDLKCPEPSPEPCRPPACANPGDCEYVNAVYDDNQCLVSCGDLKCPEPSPEPCTDRG